MEQSRQEGRKSMFKIGDKVVVTGRLFTGQKGIIIGTDKLAKPGEPQEPVWVVKLSNGIKYKFYDEQLKLNESD
jgi:hypothetical protein